jgi:hypothetical protein
MYLDWIWVRPRNPKFSGTWTDYVNVVRFRSSQSTHGTCLLSWQCTLKKQTKNNKSTYVPCIPMQ